MESGPVSAEWKNDKFGNRYDQANDIEHYFKKGMRRVQTQCNRPALLQVGEDEENTAVMRWFKKISRDTTGDGRELGLNDIKDLKIGCGGAN